MKKDKKQTISRKDDQAIPGFDLGLLDEFSVQISVI